MVSANRSTPHSIRNAGKARNLMRMPVWVRLGLRPVTLPEWCNSQSPVARIDGLALAVYRRLASPDPARH